MKAKIDLVNTNYALQYFQFAWRRENIALLLIFFCPIIFPQKSSAQGQLWGVTAGGGIHNIGMIFKANGDGTEFSLQHSFIAAPLGSDPVGGLAKASNGKLYGMAYYGGTNNAGVLFEFDPAIGSRIKKIDFNPASTGSHPNGALTEATNGKLYGMTSEGGANNDGTLFEYDPASGILTKKIDFDEPVSGSGPWGSLTEASNGKLYGMTRLGGATVQGVIFEYNITNSSLTKKIDFPSGTTGAYPQGTLTQAENGKLYGVTQQGGAMQGGILFEYDLPNNTIVKKIDFDPATTGSYPIGSLTEALNGKLYGLTSQGGSPGLGFGVLFEYDPANGNLVKKINFDPAVTGGFPRGSLREVSNGKLYGVNSVGGANKAGVLFEYDPASGNLVKKIDFNQVTNGSRPTGILAETIEGKLYGITSGGGVHDEGSLYEYDLANETIVKKTDFDPAFNGAYPFGSLVESANGKFYGVTFTGGVTDRGIIFEHDPVSGNTLRKVEFDLTVNGAPPSGSLIEAANGKLYGMTAEGGLYKQGILFEYSPSSETITKKIDFNPTIGQGPVGSLMEATNGKLYGMTYGGGANNEGTLFEFNPINGSAVRKISFASLTTGAYPTGSLTQAANGKLYGMTPYGGASYQEGVLFEYDPTSGDLIKKIDFAIGEYPFGSLTAASNGKLYGMTTNGGATNHGTIFEYNPATGKKEKKIDFALSSTGAYPYGTLTEAPNGKLYGMTAEGGAYDEGAFVEYDPTTEEIVKKIDFIGGNKIHPNYDYRLIFVKDTQTISFAPLQGKIIGDAPFNISATTNSSLPVSFSTPSDKISISGNQVTIMKEGSATIKASQDGNASTKPAPTVERTFCINPAKPTITVSNSTAETSVLTSSRDTGNQWFLNGSPIGGATNATFNVTQSGTYKLQVSVDNCLSEFSAEQSLVITGGLENYSGNQNAEVYPVPVSDWLTVTLGDGEGVKNVSIYQIDGKQKVSAEVSGKEARFNVIDYAPGLYVIKVQSEKTLQIIRFMKQ